MSSSPPGAASGASAVVSGSTPPLVAVRGLHETVQAGCGNAMLHVRTLDDVSLDVHAGDLVLVAGGAGTGAPSLVASLAGRRRITHGVREVGQGVRVRRGCIPTEARDAIVAGWTSPVSAGTRRYRVERAVTAYILRVQCQSALQAPAACNAHIAGSRTDAWYTWSRALRDGGSAIVLWDSGSPSARMMAPREEATVPPSRARRDGHSPAATHLVQEALQPPVNAECTARVRLLQLSAGRIVLEETVSAGPSHSPSECPAPHREPVQ